MTKTTEQSNPIDASDFLDLQATFLNHDALDQAITAYLTELAVKLSCERVSLALLENKAIKIKAISHESGINSVELSQYLISAMDESISQKSILKYPTNIDEQPKIVVAQAALSQHTTNHIITVPLEESGVIFGVMVFELPQAGSTNHDDISTITRASALFAPVLNLKSQSKLPISALLWNRIRNFCRSDQKNEGQHYKRYLAAIGLLALLAASFLPISHHVGAPARLEGLIQRALVAPEDGFLQQSYVRPGDLVKKGQVLAELADQDLILTRQQKQSELAQYQNAYGAALASSDRVQMMVNQSKMNEVNSQLLLIDQKIARTKLVAPFDGVVIKGDLQQSLGAPVQKGDALITVSPANAFRLMIEVDEKDIDLVNLDQTGKLALVSLPDQKMPFIVKNVTPIATVKEGHNYFEVEAEINSAEISAQLQPGMEGVAKIQAGKATIFWKLTHRFFDWLRLTLWSWGW